MPSNYRVGIGISEVTDTAIGLQMQGFADERQKTGGVESPLFSRAFILEDQGTGKRVVIVSADIWAATNVVKQEVVKRLQEQFHAVYTNDSVLISGTHCHSAPGGYAGYRLYDITGKGFDAHTFESIVAGIVASIRYAHEDVGPGKIFLNKGDIEDCGRNRSLAAYNKNPEPERVRYRADTDREMLLLKFTRQDSSGEYRPIGALSWFAIHPTDRGQQNRQVCGDNKGFASFLFENAMNPPSASKTFVAAFANANAGDVSGNVEYGHIPNGIDDVQHMERHGILQYRMARRLFDEASEELSGSIDYRHKYVDMSNVLIEDGKGARTWPAALGLSFAAGSTEDGEAQPPTGLKEGITRLRAILPTEDAMLSLGAWAGALFENIPNALKFSNEEQAGHFPKPILFAVGASEGLAPKILPLQILRIGQFVIIGVPAELTTMAGRRLRETVLNELSGEGVQHVAIAGYANDYSQYVTTTEEYCEQHYEGASTLFGPFTLQAYQQEFRKLTRALREGDRVDPGVPPPANSSPTAKRWTFRNLSKNDVQLIFYNTGDRAQAEPLPNGIQTIPAHREVAFPEREFTGLFLPTVNRAKIIFNGAQEKIVEVNQLVTISDRDGIEITEYRPIRGYPAGGGGVRALQTLLSHAQCRCFAFDAGTRRLDHVIAYVPGPGTIKGMIFGKRYIDWSGPGWDSIKGYLENTADCAFAFDFYGAGLNNLVLYRPGTGKISIMRSQWSTSSSPSCLSGYQPVRFWPIYEWSSGIDGYDLSSPADRAFAFDYDSTGKQDHLVLYRPGGGAITILKNLGSEFVPVYPQGALGNGIGGHDLKSVADRAFAFDYESIGKQDHLVLYRPGTGKITILKNRKGQFKPVNPQGVVGNGIGEYDLKSPADRVFAFDYESIGKQDHLVLYRPGTGAIMILKNRGGQFTRVYPQGALGNGIGGYDLSSPADRAFAFDYNGIGKLDHLMLYRPSSGLFVVVKKDDQGTFSRVFPKYVWGSAD